MFTVENPALKLTLIILFLLTRYLVLIYFIWQFSVRKHSYTTLTNCVTLTTNVRSILTYQLYHWIFIFNLEFSRVKSTLCALLSQFKWDLFIINMCLKKTICPVILWYIEYHANVKLKVSMVFGLKPSLYKFNCFRHYMVSCWHNKHIDRASLPYFWRIKFYIITCIFLRKGIIWFIDFKLFEAIAKWYLSDLVIIGK